MQIEQPQKPILIYYKARGIAQIIRFVLFEIGVDFEQVFVNCSGYLDLKIKQKYNIDLKRLPYFIHNGIVINGIMPIIRYCCEQFQRMDLFGKTHQDIIHISQIMVKELRQKGILLNTLFKGLKQVIDKKQGKQGQQKLKNRIFQIASCKLLLPLKQRFIKSGGYIFNYLTVVDFMYYDKSFYAVNFFDKHHPDLEFARKYYQFFQSRQFFKKNQKKIKQYRVFFPQTQFEINMLIKQMWIGDPKYVCCY